MDDNAGKYVVHNGTLREYTDKVGIELDQIKGRAAYEVIRIIDGVPLFFEDHYDRLTRTFNAVGRSLDMSFAQLSESLHMLLEKSGCRNCNVKISIFYETQDQQKLAYISKSYYPTVEEADTGVDTGLLSIERDNPNAKIINKAYKQTVTRKIEEEGLFEVLLVDGKGRLTEGSKSNLFFIKDGKVLTAPGEYVLKGITRKYVFEACRNAGFEVTEHFIRADEIAQTEGAFLSGTSIKVLPIRTVDRLVLNSSANPVIAAIRREYDEILRKYIEKHVKIW
jgi:branched-chain amino acid aminotransferase